MNDGLDIFEHLIVLENGKVKVLRSIEDIENLLEKLTSMQGTFRNHRTQRGEKTKADLDYIIRLITNMASFVYEKELNKAK